MSSLASSSYLAVLRLPGAGYAFGVGLVGRLGYALVVLPLLFTIQRATGSLGLAGLGLSLFGLATLTAPLKSRLLDGHGQTPVLTVLGVLFPIPLMLLAVAAPALPPGALLVVTIVAGLLAPPLGPAMRYLWSRIAGRSELKQRAYALDAIAEETLGTLGPAFAGAVVALGRPAVALEITAVVALVGTLGLATSPLCRAYGGPRRGPVAETPARSPWGPLRVAALWPVIAAVTAVGTSLGIVEIAVAARASAAGHPGVAGYLLACLALGSVLGAAAWGRGRHGRRRTRQLVGLMALFALGVGLTAPAPSLAVAAVPLLVAGLGLSPVFVVAFLGADDAVSPTQRTEATTWVNTGNNMGAAAGSAVAGWLVAESSPYVALLAAASVVALGIGVLLVLDTLLSGQP